MIRFQAKKFEHLFEGEVVGAHWQILTPGGHVAMDHIGNAPMAHNMCSQLNAALEPALAEEREAFVQLVEAALGVENAVETEQFLFVRSKEVAVLKDALAEVSEATGVII